MPGLDMVSRRLLEDAHPEWRAIMLRVAEVYPCRVISSYRGEEEQTRLFNKGASKTPWPKSKHNTYPSLALDVVPDPIPEDWGDHDWKERVKFYEMSMVIVAMARQLGHDIRRGADWDQDNEYRDQNFDDLVHHELQLNAWRAAA